MSPEQAVRLAAQSADELARLVARQLALVVVEQFGVRDHRAERRLGSWLAVDGNTSSSGSGP